MKAVLPDAAPRFAFDLSSSMPEVPRLLQLSTDSDRPVAALTMAVAHLLAGRRFYGTYENASPQELHGLLVAGAAALGVPLERMFKWAQSLLMPYERMANETEMAAVPTRSESQGFDLDAYQTREAGWCAIRMGAVLDFGCGIGKTETAVAAAIAASKLGTCARTRLLIVRPLSAEAVWNERVADLRPHFDAIKFCNTDMVHHLKALDDVGGAMIVDEVHRAGNTDSRRTMAVLDVRRKFDWCLCLTGTLLHAGAETMLNVQDLALPGLSRFTDKYKFAETFHCLRVAKVPTTNGKMQKRRSLTIVPFEHRPALAAYLARGVISLSFDSPEIAAQAKVPEQVRHLIYDWKRPWEDDADPRLWSPSADSDVYMGALAVAMMHEHAEVLLERTAVFLGHDFDSAEDAYAALSSRVSSPTFPIQHQKEALSLVRNWGLPVFGRLLYAMCREGRYERYIRRVMQTLPNGQQITTDYRFAYGDGGTRDLPAPGPKVRWVLDWLANNPNEAVLIGAGGSGTVDILIRCLTALGVPHGVIRGGVDGAVRGELTDQFQAGAIRAMVVQEVAGSESITLTRAMTTILVDHDWKATPYSQYLGRTRRRGQTRVTHHWDLSFNPVQGLVVQRLRRGDDFDAETRKHMEEVYQSRRGLTKLP